MGLFDRWEKLFPAEKTVEEKAIQKEITKEEYAQRCRQISPVITGRRNGMVHQFHLLIFQCAECGRCYEYRDDMTRNALFEYKGKKYCLPCWDKKQQEFTEPCVRCGKPLPIAKKWNSYYGMCRECWLKELPQLRKNYAVYEKRFRTYLSGQGVTLKENYTVGLDETGRPPYSVKDVDKGLLPLRDNEYALYLFDVRDAVLAFPSNAISLRYIKPSGNPEFMKSLGRQERLLCAVSDGKDFYALSGRGEIFSSNPEWDKRRMFEPLEYCREIAKSYFTEEEIRSAVEAFCTKGIQNVGGDRTYYDPEAQKFFRVAVDGNYYHGYDVDYPLMTKEQVLREITYYFFSIDQFENTCREKKVPIVLIADALPWTPGPYTPPENFGYGRHFI
ncbi:MAG: hypothetical protein IIU06_01320 [Erysipelotrichales bacterium]|nr:hypothetical protein [Erysipelotrichales bacterium]